MCGRWGTANAVLHHDNLEFLEDVAPKTTTYKQVKDQAAATRAKLKGEKKAEEPAAGLPNGKRQKSLPSGSQANGRAPSRTAGEDDPSAQLQLEMRQARDHDDDVAMTG